MAAVSDGNPPLRIPTTSLVLLIGPSSAGKSTWAAKWFRHEQVVASDDLRAMVGEGRDDQRASPDAFEVLERIVTARVSRRLLTVIDTLGMDEGRRAGWIAAAHERRMTVVAVRFPTDATIVRARNAVRRPQLPRAVLNRQIRGMSVTTTDLLLAEGIDVIADHPGTQDLPVQIVPGPLVDAPQRMTIQRKDPSTMRLGLQIARFDPPATDLADHLAAVAVAADEVGFDSLWVMDHMLQIPQVGREWEDMLESWTTLAWLAGQTRRIRLGTLVTGITYRNLAHLAKIVATVDVLSRGRVICGLGAAWFEREHKAYGWPFPDLAQRYDLLRDACELLPLMWGPGSPMFEGRTMTVPEAICYPRPVQDRIPILVGGSGERTTLRLVAEHADACNLFGDAETVARRVAILAGHCRDVGRDPAEVEVTNLVTFLAAPDADTLHHRLADLTPAGRSIETTAEKVNAGTVEEQIGHLRAYADAGVQTAIISMPVIDEERVRELAPLVQAFAP